MKIPSIIHQIHTRGLAGLAPHESDAVNSLKYGNIGWEHRFYDEQAIFWFLTQLNMPRYTNAYYSINPLYGAARADYFRYLLMWRIGGVYLDVKSYTTAPLRDIIRPDDEMLVFQWQGHPEKSYDGYGTHSGIKKGYEYQQWNIFSAPNNKYISNVVEQITLNIENYNRKTFGVGMIGVFNTTGPIAYTNAINDVLDKNNSGFRYGGNNVVNNIIYGRQVIAMTGNKHYSQLTEDVVIPQIFCE